MNLVIVESPTKARTIGRFLGKEYVIKASMGHVMDLPKSKLSVDVEHNFTPLYALMPDKAAILAEIKKGAKGVDTIYLATDPDREGEAIASHVKDVLEGKSKGKGQNSKFKRIVFHEITKEAIEEAIKTPRALDKNLVDAQTARRVLDRLVGYKLSPLLWQKVRRGLSAGRVQSVALRLIVEREREIEKFKKENYFTVSAFLSRGPVNRFPPTSAPASLAAASNAVRAAGSPSTIATPSSDGAVQFELIEINGAKIESQEAFHLYDGDYKVSKTSIASDKQADEIVSDLQKSSYAVSDVVQKEMRRSPQAPYTTSTLQQDASRRLGLNGKRTMGLAQKLYEEGYITYHRTDSVTMAVSAQQAIISYVKKAFGDKYVPEKPRMYTAQQKLAQEAHEAIRPTKMDVNGAVVTQDIGAGYAKLYELIWRRAIASQMSDAITESTTVLVDAKSEDRKLKTDDRTQRTDNTDPSSVSSAIRHPSSDVRPPAYRLKANGSVLVFDGFLKVNPLALQDNKLPQFTTEEKLTAQAIDKTPHETPPPPRYNDASLIKTLEEKGIGRPSTYATIIGTIENRRYIERLEARFIPTSIGVAVNDFLVKNFSDIDDIPFTAEMEDQLDLVAEGKQEWEKVMKDFYTPFEKKLATVKDAARVKIAVEEVDEKCPKCGNNLVIRIGKFGKFLSCSTFPACDFTKPFVEETGLMCPKDAGKVIVKKTRKGRKFYGCSNYPNCDFAAWKLEDVKNYDPNAPKKTYGKKAEEKDNGKTDSETTGVTT